MDEASSRGGCGTSEQRLIVLFISLILVLALCIGITLPVTNRAGNITAATAHEPPAGPKSQARPPPKRPAPPPVNDSSIGGPVALAELWVSSQPPGVSGADCVSDDSGDGPQRQWSGADVEPRAALVPDTGTLLVLYEQGRWWPRDSSSRLMVMRRTSIGAITQEPQGLTKCGGVAAGGADRVGEARIVAASSSAVVLVARLWWLPSAFDASAQAGDRLTALVSRDDGRTWRALEGGLNAVEEAVEDLALMPSGEVNLVTRTSDGTLPGPLLQLRRRRHALASSLAGELGHGRRRRHGPRWCRSLRGHARPQHEPRAGAARVAAGAGHGGRPRGERRGHARAPARGLCAKPLY